MLDQIDIKGKVITADALLTQRTLAEYLVEGNYSALSAVRHIATLQKQSLTWFFCIFLF